MKSTQLQVMLRVIAHCTKMCNSKKHKKHHFIFFCYKKSKREKKNNFRNLFIPSMKVIIKGNNIYFD